MRSSLLVLPLLFLPSPHLEAGALEKAYFTATEVGSWAIYESNWEMPDGMAGTNVYTYVRAPDSANRVRIEVVTRTLAGPGTGMISRQLFIMGPGFDLTTNYLSRMMFLEASVSQIGDGVASLMQEDVIDIMRQSAADFTNSVTFGGRHQLQGIECDLYSYSFTSGGPHATAQEGEICLLETVPFGIVFQKGRVTDAEGLPVSSFEEKLVESGKGRPASEVLLAMTPEPGPETSGAVPALPLMEAYETGKVRLAVEVVDGSGGRLLDLVIVNATEESLDLVVPGGSLDFAADSPLGALKVSVEEELRLSLEPGGSSPSFSVAQSGDRGATAGKFNLVVYEGQPLYQGSVTVGPLE